MIKWLNIWNKQSENILLASLQMFSRTISQSCLDTAVTVALVASVQKSQRDECCVNSDNECQQVYSYSCLKI